MKTTKLLAAVTAAALLSFGAAGTAFAAAGDGSGDSATATQARAAHPKGKVRKLRRAALRVALQAAAKAIGVPPSELRDALRSGQSIAQFAQSKGVSTDSVVDAIVKAIDDKIDQAVTSGRLPKARADKLEARVPTLARKLVNRVPRRYASKAGDSQPADMPQT